MPNRASPNRYQATAILFAVSLFNAFDRSIAMAVIEPIRGEWSLSDKEVGLLAGAFTLVYAVSGIPLGMVADRVRRFRFLALATLLWSVSTALGGMVSTYRQMLATRLVVGLTESSFFPTSMSLLGDLFSSRGRNRAVGIVLIGIPLGVSLSFGLGGKIAQAHGWRAAFFVPLVPGLLAALFCFLTREPERGGSEERAIGAKRRGDSAARVLFGVPTFRWVVVSGTFLMFASLTQASFLNPLLVRYHHMSVEEAGKSMAIIAGLAPIVGMIAAGALTDRLMRKRRDAAVVVSLVCAVVAIPAMLVALRCSPDERSLMIGAFVVAQVLTFPLISMQQTIIQEVVEPSLRGTAVAIHSLAGSILGAAVGPLVTGAISDSLARRAANVGSGPVPVEVLEPFRPEALRQAMFIVPAAFGLLALTLLVCLRFARRDAAALSAWMEKEALAEERA